MTVYLDKERIVTLQDLLGKVMMNTNLIIDDKELYNEVKKQYYFLDELTKLEVGTLLELI